MKSCSKHIFNETRIKKSPLGQWKSGVIR